MDHLRGKHSWGQQLRELRIHGTPKVTPQENFFFFALPLDIILQYSHRGSNSCNDRRPGVALQFLENIHFDYLEEEGPQTLR